MRILNERQHQQHQHTSQHHAGGLPLINGELPEEQRLALRDEWMSQTAEDAHAKSWGCTTCHAGIEKMHRQETVQLGCTDCHGGNPNATTKKCAHVPPRYPQYWNTSANPPRTFAMLNAEAPEFVRFINPGDWRAAGMSCGVCHADEYRVNRKSIMGHSAMVPGSALYNNGSVPNKIYRYGEVYSWGGRANRIFSTPRATVDDVRLRGVLPFIDPLPRYEITQPGNLFRVLEINNNATSLRGPGTDFRTDAVFLNLVKTKLNDPTMAFLGMNDHPGDFRSSGCTACHVLYANDRDPDHSAHISQYGNRGYSASSDPTIPRGESGHPIKHQLTRSIPSSQCMTCHFHQGSGAIGNYYGYMWWDYETDAEKVYSRYGNPLPSAYVGSKSNKPMFNMWEEVNPEIWGNKFADYHNAGWPMQAVYLRNSKGELLDHDRNVIPTGTPDWHKMAVHLSDIHMQKGMHCIDCHFKQDVHGDGKLYGSMINAVEIACKDCHGTVRARATLVTSNHPGGNDLTHGVTPWGEPRFEVLRDKIVQRSNVTRGVKWEVPQIVDSINPGHPKYNQRAHYAKTIERDGVTWGHVEKDPAQCRHAHSSDSMTCYACHSTWNTTCAGCHLDVKTNTVRPVLHYEGGFSKFYAAYNPQVMRADGFLLGKNGVAKGNRVSPVRSASGVIVSAAAGNREMVLHQQPTIAAEGHSGHAFTTNPPHTVGPKAATRTCSSCHVSENGNNNAVMAGVLGLGKRSADFIGRYLWVAAADGGVEAVRVTTSEDFPKPVIGSQFHRVLDPKDFAQHVEKNKGWLKSAYRHHVKNARTILKVGEWVLVADSKRGFQAYDIANVHNKDQAQKVVTSLISPLGQRQFVRTRHATSVTMAVNLPTDLERTHRPENLEPPIHPLFRFAYITDFAEGLIIVDINTLFDGNPSNNFFRRAATFNPNGVLNGAVRAKIWGNFAYVLTCHNGLVVVDISNPCQPQIAGMLGPDAINNPRSIDMQFRYAFITDAEGVKIVDITMPQYPRLASVVHVPDARGLTVMRTYAYIAAGSQGLGVLDVESPEAPGLLQFFDAGGVINDATDVVVGATYASFYAYVADGKNGVRVLQLTTPEYGLAKGTSPEPRPHLIASYKTKGPAIALAEGMPRDRHVDIDGNQFSVFGRLGSRSFNRDELRSMYLRSGEVYTVPDEPPGQPAEIVPMPPQVPAQLPEPR